MNAKRLEESITVMEDLLLMAQRDVRERTLAGDWLSVQASAEIVAAVEDALACMNHDLVRMVRTGATA